MNKKELRINMKEKRNSLSVSKRVQYDKKIIEYLKPLLKGNIGSYRAFQSEVSLQVLEKETNLHLSYCGIENENLVFYAFDKEIKFIQHPLGMQNAVGTHIVDTLDVILVPLLAFNEEGYRLGYGGGYYDRFLKDCKALKIGVAYSMQELFSLPLDPWDIPLDLIVCETGIKLAKRGND